MSHQPFVAMPYDGPPDAFLPRRYPQLLRGPLFKPWRPLASLGILIGAGIAVLAVGTFLLVGAVMLKPGLMEQMQNAQDHPELLMTDETAPLLLLLNNIILALAIPSAMVANWGAHGWRPGWLGSVAGRIRWGWLARCIGVTLVIQFVGLGITMALGGLPKGNGKDVVLLLAIVLLTTPFQAAGEEYFFRGWLTQNIGSWIVKPATAALVSGAVSAGMFALAHGNQNLWLSLDRFGFGVLASYLTWLTGGLEAAIAMHALNNIFVFIPVILAGQVAQTVSVSQAPMGLVLFDLVFMSVTAAVFWWVATRSRIEPNFIPPLR